MFSTERRDTRSTLLITKLKTTSDFFSKFFTKNLVRIYNLKNLFDKKHMDLLVQIHIFNENIEN